MVPSSRSGTLHARHQNRARPHRRRQVDRGEGGLQRVGFGAGEEAELELVRGDDVSRRDDLLAQQDRDGRCDEASGLRIAHDRVARVHRTGVRGLDPGDGVDDHVSDALAALVAAEHGIDLAEHATFLDAGEHLAYVVRIDHRATPGAVAGVVREVHGVDRQHLDADALQREDRGGVSDMSVRDGGLDGEDLHSPILSFRAGEFPRRWGIVRWVIVWPRRGRR